MLLLIYILLWLYSLQEIIHYILDEYNFKIMCIITYSIWFLVSIYSEYNRLVYNSYEEYKMFIPVCVYSLNLFYLYELYYYTPDIGHIIHHILTILLQTYCYTSMFFNYNVNIVIGCSAYWSMITSVLSALRYIIGRNSNYSNLIHNLYKIMFIIFKGGSIILYYGIIYKNWYIINFNDFLIIYLLYFLVHINQTYFIYRIIKNYLYF
jgi:hypothetical protein